MSPANTTATGGAILVVDDDPAITDMLLELLGSQGYDVDVLHDGNAVLAQLAARSYRALLLDVLLPHVSGFALLTQIRAVPAFATLPIIVMSGIYRGRSHRSALAPHNIIDYLDKPLSSERLIALLQQHAANPGSPAAPPIEKRPEPTQTSYDKTAFDKLADVEAKQEKRQVENDARSQFKPNAFLMQGAIGNQPVAAVLGKLWRARASGALLLRQGEMKKIFYLRGGSPYTVRSNLINECLGQVLVEARLISLEELEKSVVLMKEAGKRQGEVLIEMGCLTPKNLRYGLEQQLVTKLFSTFNWDHGDYRFNPSSPLPPVDIALSWQSPALIVEGIRRSMDETRLRELMIPALDIPVRRRDDALDFAKLGLDTDEERALREAPWPQTSRVLLETMSTDPYDTLRLIYTLIALEELVPATTA